MSPLSHTSARTKPGLKAAQQHFAYLVLCELCSLPTFASTPALTLAFERSAFLSSLCFHNFRNVFYFSRGVETASEEDCWQCSSQHWPISKAEIMLWKQNLFVLCFKYDNCFFGHHFVFFLIFRRKSATTRLTQGCKSA